MSEGWGLWVHGPLPEDVARDPDDYKFFCFDGEPKALFVATERQLECETKFDFYDIDFNHLPFENGHPNAAVPPEKPSSYDEMLELSRVLSAGLPHVRVDFFDIGGRPVFGEMTLYHWSGLKLFVPEEWDCIFGSWSTFPD